MSIDTTSYYDSLSKTSSGPASLGVTTDEGSTKLTAEDFLTLLVTELQYQDPTEPMDNAEMVSQLTGYSQLDELSSMNEKMDALTESINTMTGTNGLEYLGKQIEAKGNAVTKNGDEMSTLYFQLDEKATSLTFNIYGSNGAIVDTKTYTDVAAGAGAFKWDGTNSNGNTLSDGTYYALASSEDANGNTADVSTTTTGTVSGVSSTDDGVVLTLKDGRTVNMLSVTYATN